VRLSCQSTRHLPCWDAQANVVFSLVDEVLKFFERQFFMQTTTREDVKAVAAKKEQ